MAVTVTVEYYNNTYHGAAFDDIATILQRAQDVIDNIISCEPQGSYQTEHYMKAVCAQAEYIGNAGGTASWSAASSGTSFTIGSFSMSGVSGTGAGSLTSTAACALSQGYLESAGLMCRGVAMSAPGRELI